LDIWGYILRMVAEEGSAKIGLFHSGYELVHPATVIDLIPPVEDEFGIFKFPPPPEDELDLIPDYYRASRHSRAWLKIRSISEQPINFFGEFSYAEPPLLPGYSPSQLAQFAGKKILDAAELRAMDTTIWQVRRSIPHDRRDRVLTARAEYLAPLLARPINCPGDWILHITDPHYALGRFRGEHVWRLETEPGYAPPTMVDAISSAIDRAGRTVGAILITGDLTFVGSEEEFEVARSGLFKLTNGLLGLGLEHLVIVPGNHDIVWTRGDAYEDDAAVNVAPESATENFRNFFRRMFGFEAAAHLSMARRFVFPGGRLIDVVAVNSSSLEQGESFLAGMGRVQEAGYTEATRKLAWQMGDGLSLRILALHHHLALTENLESASEYRKGFGIAVDAPRVQRMAARDGVHVAIHGHKHRAFVWRSGAYELPETTAARWELGQINIIGGGSAGSRSTDGSRNFFNLIRLVGCEVELEMYRCENGGDFELFTVWRAPLEPRSVRSRSHGRVPVEVTKGGLEIGPWYRTDLS
jgi:hypothetical protein